MEVVLPGLLHTTTADVGWRGWWMGRHIPPPRLVERRTRAQLGTAEGLHIDAEFFHLVVKGSLRHLQQLQRFVNPAMGPSQSKADEEAFELLHDLVPGCFLLSTPQQVF